MKRSELFIVASLIPSDIIAIILAFTLAYKLRVQFDIVYVWSFIDYIRFVLMLVPLWIVIFTMAGLYKIQVLKASALDNLALVFVSVSAGIMLVVAYIFLSKTEFFSRLIVIYAWLISIVVVFTFREIIKFIRRYLMRFGIGVHRVIIIGSYSKSQEVINLINTNIYLGFKITKVIDKNAIDKIEAILMRNPTDAIIVSDPSISDEQINNLIDLTQDYHIDIKLVPNIVKLKEANISTQTLYGIPIINLHKTPLDGWGAIIKRIMDLILASIAVIIFSPIFLIIAVLIKITSKGPVIYKNIRIGQRGEFVTYKFRTMHFEYCTGARYGGARAEDFEDKLIEKNNLKKGSAVYKIGNDPRITRIGKFLRKTSLDELPQFFNVLKGNMSLVGPRPHQPKEVQNYTKRQKKLLIIKPGITGMAQISGRSDLTFEDEAKLDIYYLENWSIWLDIQIILRTFVAVFASKGAY